jgi:hypothetical protein
MANFKGFLQFLGYGIRDTSFIVDERSIVRRFREDKGNMGIPDAGHTAFPTHQGLAQDAMDQQGMPEYPNVPRTMVTSHPMNPSAGTMTGKGGRTAAAPGISAPAHPLPNQFTGPAVPGMGQDS